MSQPSNQQLKKDLSALTTYPEWPAFQSLVNSYLAELENVRNLNPALPAALDVQALGRKYAGELVRDLFATILAIKSQQENGSKPDQSE